MPEKYLIGRNIRPPRLAIRFLRWFCPPYLCEGIEGDLLEQFGENAQSLADGDHQGIRKARRKFWWAVIIFFRPGIVFRNRFSFRIGENGMLRNYFKVSWRHINRNRGFAAINMLGLATGIASALLVYDYVSFEKSFDTFHAAHENIYRVTTEWNRDVTPGDHRATTVPWVGPAASEAFAEVQAYARFAPMDIFTGQTSVAYHETKIIGQNIFLADPGFLKIFSFPLLKGDRESALNDPTDIVITESIARKYFGTEDVLGKILLIDTHGNLSQDQFTVSGVIRDPPANSHITFDFLVSFNVLWKGFDSGSVYWHWDYAYAYLLLQPGSDIASLEKKISALRVAQHGKEMQHYPDQVDFRLQPLKDIHLFSSLKGEASVNSDGNALLFIVIVGFCIMLSAYINYINLSTVKSAERRTEIGIRKVVGSTGLQLTMQLLVESLVLNVLAFILGFFISRLSIPVIEVIFNIQWPPWNSGLISGDFLLVAALTITAGIILSALYPALISSACKPVDVLKGKAPVPGSYRGWNLRKTLIVMQFAFCIAFCLGTFVLHRQLRFMKDHELGMNPRQVLVVRGYGFQPLSVYDHFRNELSQEPSVQSIGFSSASPGDEIVQLSLRPKVKIAGASAGEREVKLVSIDEHYFHTLQVAMLKGRSFDRSSPADAKSVIVSEAAARLLGYPQPADIVNESLSGLDQEALRVIGVIEDYNQRSLRNNYEPLVFQPAWTSNFGWNERFFFVRLEPVEGLDARQEQVRKVEMAWKEASPDQPFQFFFLDSHFDHQYKADSAFTSLFLFFSVLAVFIACLGLFGLVAYTTLQRTKEIGVRKVMGASVRNILFMLSGDFAALIAIAALLSTPVMYFVIRRWLDQYPFRMEMSPWLFLIPLLLIFILALLTVVLKSMRVARANPVASLRHE